MLQSKQILLELNAKLAEMLTSKGVTATADETTTALVNKVGDINGGTEEYYLSPSTQLYYKADMVFSIEIPPTMNGCKNLITVKYLNGTKRLNTQQLFGCNNLTYLYLPNTLNYPGGGTVSFKCPKLEVIELEDGFNCDICIFSHSTLFSRETIVNCFKAFADRTGLTAYTFTINKVVGDKLTDEDRAIATAKNWTIVEKEV